MNIDWKWLIIGALLGYFSTGILNKVHGMTSKAA